MRASSVPYKLMMMTILLLLLLNERITNTGIFAFRTNTVSISRGRTTVLQSGNDDDGTNLPTPTEDSDPCVFDGGTIVLSHPSSLGVSDRYYGIGSLMLEAAGMTIDKINTDRCGVQLNDGRYSLRLNTYGDESDQRKTERIGETLVNQTDFLLAGYTSYLTGFLTPVAEANQRLLITAGSSRTSVHADRDHVFGMLPPSNSYFDNAYIATSEMGAKTVAILRDDDIAACNPEDAERFGFELLYLQDVGENKTSEFFHEAASNVSQLDPDFMITCLRTSASLWVESMRKYDWTPKAHVLFGTINIQEELGVDAIGMMGTASWVSSLPPVADSVTNWTPAGFASSFEDYTHRPAQYQQVAQSAAISVLVQAIEQVGSITNTEAILNALRSTTFSTVYGEISFDENGQSQAPTLLLQLDASSENKVLLPKELSSDATIVYPLPTWKKRDCTSRSNCIESGGECIDDDGSCTCPVPLIQIGNGATAACKAVRTEEDMTYIEEDMISAGYTYIGVQCLISLICVTWTIYNRNANIVRASQPMFLHLVSFGCLVLILSIVPNTVQGDYRYFQDPVTLQPSDEFNQEILKVDHACMSFPWLFGWGFGIVFSALFAKIYRIRKMIANAQTFRRRRVGGYQVLHLVAITLAGESMILLPWALIDPLQWQRDVLLMDEDQLPLKSAGHCTSDTAPVFWLSLVAFNVCILIYALYLCYVTRDYPSHFAESRWITICVVSYLQILLLSVPIVIIVQDNNTVSFFVIATVVFLMSTSVSLLIFVPKMCKLHLANTDEQGNIIDADAVDRNNRGRVRHLLRMMSIVISKPNGAGNADDNTRSPLTFVSGLVEAKPTETKKRDGASTELTKGSSAKGVTSSQAPDMRQSLSDSRHSLEKPKKMNLINQEDIVENAESTVSCTNGESGSSSGGQDLRVSLSNSDDSETDAAERKENLEDL